MAAQDGVYNTSYASKLEDNSDMFRALDTHEISAGSSSMEDSLGSYVKYGLADAVVSAGVGLYNTGAALGQVIGVAGKDAQVDEGDAVNSLLGADAASFYGRHKQGIDATGMVLGSLVPGLAAVRGLRMLQTAGKVSSVLEGATGLKNADIVMNSVAVESAKKYALETTTAAPNWFSGPMIKAYAQGYKQQVMEAGAFEAATLVTMNQNATLNPDDLGYFTAIGDQFWNATKFAAFGGLLGGGIDTLRIFGAVRKYGADEWTRAAPLNEVNLGYSTGTPGGNKLLELGREADRRADLEKDIAPTDWFGKKQFAAGQSVLKSAMLDVFGKINQAGTEGYNVLEKMVQDSTSDNLGSMATVLSGLKGIENVAVKDLEDLSGFYAKTRTPTMIAEGNTSLQIANTMADAQTEFMQVMNKIKPLAGDLDENNLKLGDHLDAIMGNPVGFAYPSKGSVPGTTFNMRMVRAQYKGADGEGVMLLPDFMGLNTENLKTAYNVNKIYAERTGKEFTQTPEQFKDYVMLHEMGHIKNNTSKLTTLVRNNMDEMTASGTDNKIVRQLVTASLRSREPDWFMTQGGRFNELSETDKVNVILGKLTGNKSAGLMSNKGLGGIDYLGDPSELLADGAAYMTRTETRELGAKHFPDLAELFNSEGAIAKAWDDTKAYFNSRTKEIHTSYLPGIADVDKNAQVVTKGMETKLVSPALNRSFQLNTGLFNQESITSALTTKADHLDYDAQWIMADRLQSKDLVGKDGVVNIAKDNLPVMEKLSVLNAQKNPEIQEAFAKGNVRLDGQVVTPESLPELTLQRKQDIRMLLASSNVGYNEQEIARMLNVDIPQAMGDLSAPKDGWMLLGSKDYTKPEIFTMKYDQKNMADYQGAVMNMTGVSVANDAVKAQNEATAASLTGDLYKNLPEMEDSMVRAVNPFASRAGLVSNLRSEVGSLRERVAHIGKLVSQKALNVVKGIDEGFVSAASTFNRKDSGALRFELAQVDNVLRREHYYPVTSESGSSYVVRKYVFQDMSKRMFGQYHPDMLHGFPDEEIAGLVGSGDKWAPDALELGPEVAQFYSDHALRNASIVDRKMEVANARGMNSNLDRDVLYAPPRDLSKQKYFALIEPSVFKEGSDPRRFMLYGETAAELESKKLAIQQKYGTDYNIDTRADRMALLKAGKTQGSDGAFDELDFDSSLFRKGDSSELSPNVDVNTSSTLERYRSWTIGQEEKLLRTGVEMKYQPIVDKLKRFDQEYGKQETNTINKRWQDASTIWRDTLDTMVNKKSRGSALEQEFVRVNDYLGTKGSQFLDSAFSGFRKFGDRPITQEALNDWNAKLDAAGYHSPFDKVAEVMLSSPDTTQSNLFPAAVKTMSKLVSTLMLGLDPANSLMQIISTPILTLPVLMEAKRALKGTEAGERLAGATSVMNPVTRDVEPTSAKLLATATTKFWSPEGKEFMQQLKDRNIITDELQRYHDVLDMSELNGRHTMKQVNDKLDSLAKYGSYFSARNFSENYGRFVTAWAVKDLAEIRGLGADEMWSLVSGSVDKVHGVYSGAQRPQLFQGVLGQSIGLYQTYFFNFAQSLLRNVADGNTKQAAVALGLQSSLFGIQSLPGFQSLNAAIGNGNRKKDDLYSLTNADNDDGGFGQYAMYGMASHMFGTPIDFATRGALTARNMLLIPTQFKDLPIVGTLSKSIGNIIDTGMMAAQGDVGIKRALIHGLAHNAMNRPLQGIGAIMSGNADTATGQNNQQNINRLGYDANADLNWAGMFARAIGTRPLNETIVQNAYFRNAEYKANTNRELGDIGGKIQMNLADGTLEPQTFNSFARDYEMAGGEMQSFNAFWGRQLKQAGNGTMAKFRDQITQEKTSELGRTSVRLAAKQSAEPPWQVGEQ